MQRHFRSAAEAAAARSEDETRAAALRRAVPEYLGVAPTAELMLRRLSGEVIAAPLAHLLENLSGIELAQILYDPPGEGWHDLLCMLDGKWPLPGTSAPASAPAAPRVVEKWQEFCRQISEETPLGVAGKRRQNGGVDQPLHLVDDASGPLGIDAGDQQRDDAREPVDQRVCIRITVGHGVTSVEIETANLPDAPAIRKAEG